MDQATHGPLAGVKPVSPDSLNAIEAKMREEIKRLQERRVNVLLEEVASLEAEKHTLLSKVCSLEAERDVLQEESSQLKNVTKPTSITLLEEALQLEREEKTKLKQKLRVIKKRNSSLAIENNLKERSSSLNDMQEQSDTAEQKDDTPSTDECFQAVQKTQSDSLKPRRYVLAAGLTNSAATQTPWAFAIDTTDTVQLSDDVRSTLTEAKTGILEMLREKEAIEQQLLMREAECTALKQTVDAFKSLEEECVLLRRNLDMSRQWVSTKLHDIKEEMDICKVIYSLHRSLSQEASVIEKLNDKLQDQQQLVLKLQSENRMLKDKLYSSQKQVHLMKNKSEPNQAVSHKSQASNQPSSD